MTNKQILKEFREKFTEKCSDGRLMADFKNGKEVRVSKIESFLLAKLEEQRKEVLAEILSKVERKKAGYVELVGGNKLQYEKMKSWNDALDEVVKAINQIKNESETKIS